MRIKGYAHVDQKEVSVRVSLVGMACRDGTLKQVARLANGLAQVVETHLFMPAQPELAALLAPEVIHHPLASPRGASWGKLLALGNPWRHADHAKRIRRVAPDLVHLLQPHPTHALLIPLLGVPSCLSLHDVWDPASVREASLREFMSSRALAMVDHLILHDPAQVEPLHRLGLPPETLSLVPPDDEPLAYLTAYRHMLARLRSPSGFPATPA